MSYTPTNWKDGDLVTSAKLNKLEQGVAAGGIQVIHVDNENGTLDKTWQEIYDGGFGVIVGEDGGMIFYEQILMIGQMNSSTYGVTTVAFDPSGLKQHYYIASSPDDYPVWSSKPSINDPSEDDNTPNVM